MDVENTNRGEAVFAEAIPEVGPKSKETFFLMRRGGRWQIIYDSFSAVAFGAFVQDQVQSACPWSDAACGSGSAGRCGGGSSVPPNCAGVSGK